MPETKKQKKFYVMWTYIGNYGGPYERWATSAEEAGESVRQGFSQDFRDKGTVYVFGSRPRKVIKGPKASS